MKKFGILIFLALALTACQGGKNWEWTVDGLNKDYYYEYDFNDHVCVLFNPNEQKWRFWSGRIGRYYYGEARGVNKEQAKTPFGRYEFPGGFYIYYSENEPKSWTGVYPEHVEAKVEYIDWIDEGNIKIAYHVFPSSYEKTKTFRLSGGIEK